LNLGLKTSISCELERYNLNRYLDRNIESSLKDYKIFDCNNLISMKLENFLKRKSVDGIVKIWEIQGPDNLKFAVKYENYFYFKSENDFQSVHVSVKLDFHTKFGSQQMTKFELINEFVSSYFCGSLVFRYRIDVNSLMAMSVRVLEWQDVAEELKKLYNIETHDLLNFFACFIHCVHRLPIGNYLLNRRVKTETEVSKIMILQEVDSESEILFDLHQKYKTVECKIENTLSSVKFLPISKEIGLLNLKFKIPPCVFPVFRGKRKFNIKN
jgi:hypothetical protein